MRIFTVLWLFVALMVLAGCRAPSKNMLVASAKSSAGMATTVGLDNVELERYDEAKANTIQVANDLKEFVGSGELTNLPIDQLGMKMNAFLLEKGLGKYTGVVDSAVSYLQNQRVNTDVLNDYTRQVIIAALDEVIEAASMSRKDWR